MVNAVCNVVSLFCAVSFSEAVGFTVSVLEGIIGARVKKPVEGTVELLVD